MRASSQATILTTERHAKIKLIDISPSLLLKGKGTPSDTNSSTVEVQNGAYADIDRLTRLLWYNAPNYAAVVYCMRHGCVQPSKDCV